MLCTLLCSLCSPHTQLGPDHVWALDYQTAAAAELETRQVCLQSPGSPHAALVLTAKPAAGFPNTSSFASLLASELQDPRSSRSAHTALSVDTFVRGNGTARGAEALYAYTLDLIKKIGDCETGRDWFANAPHLKALSSHPGFSSSEARTASFDVLVTGAQAIVAVHGPAGCGKSALLANWVAKVRAGVWSPFSLD